MKKRIIRLGVILIVSVAIAAVVLSVLQAPPPPQIITLPTGQQYKLVRVTYGTRHVHGPLLARVVNYLPAVLGNFLQRSLKGRLGTAYSFQTPEPALGVWFEPVVTNAGPGLNRTVLSSGYYPGGTDSLQAMLADENGLLAGKAGESAMSRAFALTSSGSFPIYSGSGPFPIYSGSGPFSISSGPGPFPIFFPLVPKRSRTLECCLFTVPVSVEGSSREIARVHLPNPVFGRFRAWKPEPLPATQRTGDLEVRLEHFTTGKPAPGTRLNFLTGNPAPGTRLTKFRPAEQGEEAWTGFDFTLSSPPGADAIWALHGADLSDAGGNHLRGLWSNHDQWPYQFLKGTLWPNETAWRLKLEFKRKSGFAPAELVTFTNVPLLTFGVAGPILRTNTVKGLQLVLLEYASNGALYSGTIATVLPLFRLETPNVEGTAFDFVQLVTDRGETMVMREMIDTSSGPRMVLASGLVVSPTGAVRMQPPSWPRTPLAPPPRIILFGKEPPTNAVTVNLTWAMQKTRSVEFLVRPPLP